MANSFNIKQMEQRMQAVLQRAPVKLGNQAVNFFKDSFRQQGWQGNSFEKWKPRKQVTRWGKTKRNKGRAILVDSGRLRRSIRLISAGNLQAVIGTDVPYAKAHNEGMRLGLIQQVKAFTRKPSAKYKSKERVSVKAHTRRINQNIPRRQFMGTSPILTAKLRRMLLADIMRAANQP